MKRLIPILALVASSAHAEFVDGNMLYSRLTSSKVSDQALAVGYIMGVADTMIQIMHCAPPNATAGQLNDMVKLYLEQNPATRSKTADVIVTQVLKTTWPCAKGDKS